MEAGAKMKYEQGMPSGDDQYPNSRVFRGRWTVARSFRLGSGILLSLLIASSFLSFHSIRSIGKSFDHVVTVEQPLRESASDMIEAADSATIGFLESLVSHQPISSVQAEQSFDRYMFDYRALVDRAATETQGALARDLFTRLKRYGRRLVATDLERQRAFVALQERFELMDDRFIDPHPFLSSIEPDFSEAARWVGNYVAAPSDEYADEALEEIDDAAGELAAMAKTHTGAGKVALTRLIRGVVRAREAELSIISLTQRSENDLRRFLGLRASLDRVLNDQIDRQVQSSLQKRTLQTQRVVDRSKVVLVASVIPGLLFGLGALRWVRRRISQPVGRLMAAIDSLRAGHTPAEIELPRNDEFGVLGQALTAASRQRISLEEQLRHQAFHDPLTGAANRTLFMERMEHALSRADRRATPLSVLFIDLDDFKAVNDTLGHEAGDLLLLSAAECLKGCVRAEDTVARLGGDEFGVLLEEADAAGAAEVAERVMRALRAVRSIDDNEISTAASIGVATRLQDEDVDALLHRADVAMYAAKSRGDGSWQAYEGDMDMAVDESRTLKTELQRAVRENEFVVHYQPVVDLQTQTTVAVEALVRWQHPERGLLPPIEFLDAAEASGLILYIDKWVLQEACRQVKAWQEECPEMASLIACVNLSARQLEHPGLTDEVAEALRVSGLAPRYLTLEITETVLVRDLEAAARELKHLKELGVQIALDDFGAGYSSLNYLRRFPIDVIKIDRSFISNMGQRPDQLEVGLALVEFSRRLGLRTVAEGIEEQDQLSRLTSLGCEFGQGYLFAKPLDNEQLEAFLRNGRAVSNVE